MSMTLEQVRDWHRKQAYACGISQSRQEEGMHHDMMADAIDARLTQPAQSVDVEKVREVIADLTTYGSAGSDYYSADALQDCINDAADKLTAALQEKGNG